MNKQTVRLGTRGSRLALRQADIVAERLRLLDPSLLIEIVPITTSGDRDQKTPLAQMGGKGVFIKELEHALCSNHVDIAVHSFKDVTCALAPSCVLAGFLTPESQSDVLVLRQGETLKKGMVIGTGSLRRQALLKHRFSEEVSVQQIRGNVDTRIRKVDEGVVDGALLSEAGLIRLGLQNRISKTLRPTPFYPAPGQGVIALECRTQDEPFVTFCEQLTEPHQLMESQAHLEILNQIGFDCRDPLGVCLTVDDSTFSVAGFVASQDLDSFFEYAAKGSLSSYKSVLQDWIETIKAKRQTWQ